MYVKNKINLNISSILTSMTVKNGNFESLDANSNLYIHDITGKLLDEIPLSKNYILLTYNDIENVYLMSGCCHTSHFSKLNNSFQKVGDFVIRAISPRLRRINNIFFDKSNLKYLVADDKNVYSVDLSGRFIRDEIWQGDFFIDCRRRTANDLDDYGNYDSIRRRRRNEIVFTAVASDGTYKYVAYNKNCSAYLSKISKNGSLIETTFIEDNVNIYSIGINNGIFLGINKCDGNYIYEVSEDSPGGGGIDPKINEIINKLINQLNLVAATEDSVGELINAETEKIKKILEISDDPDEILEVNNSVKDVVKEAAVLEGSESNNLKILLECIIELEKLIPKIKLTEN